MRAFALLLLLSLTAAPALAQSSADCRTATQLLTGSAPTATQDGVTLSEATGYVVVVSAPAGQTISGGSLLCYYLGVVSAPAAGAAPGSSSITTRWMRCDTALDITPTTGVRDYAKPDYTSTAGMGKVKYVPSSITLSGAGTTVDVTVCVRRRP